MDAIEAVFEALQGARLFGTAVPVLGGLGTLLGVAAIAMMLAGRRAAFALGVLALVLSAATAAATVLSTHEIEELVERVNADVDARADREQIIRRSHRDMRRVALLGLLGALVPLVLGSGAALAGARRRRAPAAERLTGQQPQGEGASLPVLALVLAGVATLGAVAVFLQWRAPIPLGRFSITDEDHESWSLVGAIDAVEERNAAVFACRYLAQAMTPFFNPGGPPWKQQREIDPAMRWREAAAACVTAAMVSWKQPAAPDPRDAYPTRDALLTSVLLQDDGQRKLVEAWRDEPAPAPDTMEALLNAGGQPLRDALENAVGDPPPVGHQGKLQGLNDGAPPVIGNGTLPKEVILRVVRAHLSQVKYCYERSLVKHPTLAGKLVVEFVIGANGKVKSAKDTSTAPLSDPQVSACVLAKLRTWVFPRPVGGGQVVVTYPFVFAPAQ